MDGQRHEWCHEAASRHPSGLMALKSFPGVTRGNHRMTAEIASSCALVPTTSIFLSNLFWVAFSHLPAAIQNVNIRTKSHAHEVLDGIHFSSNTNVLWWFCSPSASSTKS